MCCRDRPGVLAAILSLLSSAEINVANCHLGRRWVGGPPDAGGPLEAEGPQGPPAEDQEVLGMCIFHTDSVVEETLLDKIRQLEFVREAMLFATPYTLGQTRFV